MTPIIPLITYPICTFPLWLLMLITPCCVLYLCRMRLSLLCLLWVETQLLAVMGILEVFTIPFGILLELMLWNLPNTFSLIITLCQTWTPIFSFLFLKFQVLTNWTTSDPLPWPISNSRSLLRSWQIGWPL